MARSGPENALVKKMRTAATKKYGDRFVSVKYHGGQMGEAGVSDLLCCLDGIFVACEVKAPENYGNSVELAEEKGATLKQRLFIQRIANAGGVAAVVASVEHFLDILEYAEGVASSGFQKP